MKDPTKKAKNILQLIIVIISSADQEQNRIKSIEKVGRQEEKTKNT
jgi:hypothetical protein